MVRMRYTPYTAEQLIVSDPILAGHDTYEVSISYYKDRVVMFVMDSKGRFVCEEKCESIEEAKIKAKATLKKLGAVFYDEVRERE